ncbi:hypothetical protein ACM40_10015 [Chryseobacterium sp. BLS98]|uniref:hypothetical protein n=1 Tax=Chryseobacterium sp. BLS98 TaxID=885586 RepID=UPI00065AC5C2|nr:hypothetical protein [Chryseobacterium sp. BLS98]KMQ62599.1 hypothetical protein ACM40_10015 [Chryseobacterium sp. BLS98]
MKFNETSKNTIHHEYGNFLIEFEQLVLTIKITIIALFGIQGLKDHNYLRIVLQDQTAYPLNAKLRSLMSHYYKDEDKKFKIIDRLFILVNDIIEKRNFIVHGTSFIYSTNIDSDLIKDKIGKFGIKVEEEKLTVESLAELTKKVKLAERKFNNLTLCIYEPDRDLNKYFSNEQLDLLKV